MLTTTSIIVLGFLLLLCLPQANSQTYRLPDTVTPSRYDIDLMFPEAIFTGDSTSFQGEVIMTFEVTEQVSEISLHHRDVSRSEFVLSSSARELAIRSDSYNETTEIYTLYLDVILDVGTTYQLYIVYQGTLRKDEMTGVYLSTYFEESGSTSYLVVSKFEPVHARHAFPCLDAPSFKAVFALNLTYPAYLNALANTNANSSEELTIADVQYNKTVFQDTAKMSTYLLAFLISNFTCTDGYTIETGVSHSVCSRPEEANNRGWALEIGTTVMRSMESMFGLKFGSYMPKMHQLAIPDFLSGAMENWGLVSYREVYMLVDPDNSSLSYYKGLAAVVAHEFAHSWFGNLVTCQWWDYTFLNEAFARYYQYFALTTAKQTIDWEMDKIFNIEILHAALLADSTASSLSLTSSTSSPTDIAAKFSTISYSKGASVFRMIEKNIMGPDNYIYGIRNYLKTYQYQATVPSQLWEAYEPYIPSNILPTGTNFTEVLENWIEYSGHPVVYVEKSDNNVVLSQQRFLLSGTDSTSRMYYIPVTYTVSNDSTTFWNTTVKEWMIPGETLVLGYVLIDSDWIVLNNKQAGFYRVDYDSTLKAAIINQLHSNHLKIDVLNRAQLVSDYYNFARSGTSSTGYGNGTYSDTMELLSYLEHETDYYPWYAAIVGNNVLLQRIGYESEIGQRFQQWMLELMSAVYQSVQFQITDDTNMVYSLKQSTVLSKVCRYGHADCIAESKELFANWRDYGVNVPKNLRTTVYCTAIRHSDDVERDFYFLWDTYKEISLMTEVITIYSGLSCANNSTMLKWFLRQTFNESSGIRLQDFSTIWSNVYGGSKIGTDATIEFITEEYESLVGNYSSVGTLISSAAGYIYEESQIEKLEALAALSNIQDDHNTTVASAISSARSNIEWASKAAESVAAYLDDLTSADDLPSAASVLRLSNLVIVFMFVSLFFNCL